MHINSSHDAVKAINTATISAFNCARGIGALRLRIRTVLHSVNGRLWVKGGPAGCGLLRGTSETKSKMGLSVGRRHGRLRVRVMARF